MPISLNFGFHTSGMLGSLSACCICEQQGIPELIKLSHAKLFKELPPQDYVVVLALLAVGSS